MNVKDLLNTSNESERKLIRMLLAKSKETNQNVDTANVNIQSVLELPTPADPKFWYAVQC